jgi:DNA-binding transcriptional MocR family regulator
VADAGDDRSARAIAAAIGRLISTGVIADGARLPTVRELARRLGVSPTTVSDAWRSLADVGAIEARGRNGTSARRPTGPGRPRRYRRITEGPGHFELDLSTGTPDPELLPDLGPLVARVSRQSLTSSYLDQPVLPELSEALVNSWPFAPEALTVVDGAMDALDRVSQQVLRLGDRVVVEHPTFPPMLDLLDQLGCDVVPVDIDEHGMTPAGLRAALERPAAAVFLQPRAHNPTGIALTSARASDLAEVLATSNAIIIEDDHANEISAAPLVSLGHWLPARTVHVRSFSKSHGPDLRLAAVGGAGDIVTAVENRRLLGPGWSSRILQAVLIELLRDPAVADQLSVARNTYAERRKLVSAVLAANGIPHPEGDGINVWMQVADERAALVRLAACGVGAAPGGPFQVRPDDQQFLRVTAGLIRTDDAERVAELLVDAAGHLPASGSVR